MRSPLLNPMRSALLSNALRATVWLAMAGWAVPCGATPEPFAGARPVDAAVLDATRGGFTTPNGLTVSLGIERLVLLNGDVVARSSVQIADIAKLDAAQAQQTRAALSSVNLVQSGADTMNAAPMSGPLGATVVQNALNNQHIDTRTVINSSVNSVGMLTTLNFQGSIGDALARAVLTH